MRISKADFLLSLILIGFSSFLSFFIFKVLIDNVKFFNYEISAQLGDTVGGIGSFLINLFATFYLIKNFRLQREEIELQRKEIERLKENQNIDQIQIELKKLEEGIFKFDSIIEYLIKWKNEPQVNKEDIVFATPSKEFNYYLYYLYQIIELISIIEKISDKGNSGNLNFKLGQLLIRTYLPDLDKIIQLMKEIQEKERQKGISEDRFRVFYSGSLIDLEIIRENIYTHYLLSQASHLR